MNPPPSGPNLEALKHTLALVLQPLQHRLIKLNRITERTLIANGGYGGVRAAELRENPEDETFETVAVKRLFPQGDDLERIELSTAFARELKTWSATDHANILPLIGFFLDAESSVALFVSPLMPHGSIRTYIRKAKPDPAKRLDLAIDTAEGLAYLHSLIPPICHGDIKPSNVVINHELRAMLCDFGLARVVQDHPSGLTTNGFDEAGTLPYLSPELVHAPGTRRNAKTDTWAWAGVLVEVLTDKQPYGNCNSYLIPGKLKEGTLPAPVDKLLVSARMQALLLRCWEKEPGERPDMSECGSELRLERATLGDSENVGAPAGREAAQDAIEDAVPKNLIDALAALDPYRMSKDIIESSGSIDVQTFNPWSSVSRATLRGAFRWATDGTTIAVTRVSLEGERRERLEKAERYARQISILSGLDDPKNYPFLGFTVDEDFGQLWVVGPWEGNVTLSNYVYHGVKLSHAERIRLAIEVAEGLRSLHVRSPPVIHGNINEFSVVLGPERQVMLAGFACAVVRTSAGPTVPPAEDGLYTAPEVYGSEHLTPASDAWLFGCLLWKIFLNKTPPFSRGHRRHENRMPASADTLSTLPEDLKQLMLDCWKLDPDERPSIQQCVSILTKLREQETQNPSLFAEVPAATEESASESHSTLDTSDGDVGTGTTEALVVPEEVIPDQEEEAQTGGSWCCMRCTIQ